MSRTPLILLPGIIMPAALRYQRLIAELGDSIQPLTKDLEVYSGPVPPPGYSIDLEVEGISRAADLAGFDRFHLYGHSGGGAVAIAYATGHPERVRSLALDEPAFDFSQAERRARPWRGLEEIARLPQAERMAAFLRLQMRPGVEPPPPPAGPPPQWMSTRAAGIAAFTAAAPEHLIADAAFAGLEAPVYYSYGDLSSTEWEDRRDRLARLFPDFTVELYEGCSHLQTSHQAQPARVAKALRQLWERAA